MMKNLKITPNYTLLRREGFRQVDPERGVRHVPEAGVVDLQLVDSFGRHAPLVPGVMRAGVRGAELPAAPKDVAGAARIWRRPGVDDLALSGRAGRQGRHDRIDLIVRQLLRLVVDD